jgi:integrase
MACEMTHVAGQDDFTLDVQGVRDLKPAAHDGLTELRGARWTEFDLDGAEWRIPGERMKMGNLHVVPLARQAVMILRELHALSGWGLPVIADVGAADVE